MLKPILATAYSKGISKYLPFQATAVPNKAVVKGPQFIEVLSNSGSKVAFYVPKTTKASLPQEDRIYIEMGPLHNMTERAL